MENKHNMFVAVSYTLYTVDGEKKEKIEEAPASKPFEFITGFGVTLDEFEKQIAQLDKGADFEFQLSKEQAYGDFEQERVLDLDRSIFQINGHFDHENIFEGAVVPLQNEDGNRFYGRVLEIGADKVKMDLNHPLAGKTLCFSGKVIDKREATNQEIQNLVNFLSGEHSCGCGCGCDDCGGDCDDHHHDGGCGCGHCH
ncbi:MAG: peptidylprolyl isomerase [Prevotella sp.]|uniref:FKBP-type peptidyl-prolyl cis-trans isomerase n=1 Tax=Prevotella sp. P5-92 TaxID=2024222 RepID=UPI000B96C70E|nr:FKBP-type peptidyl-prolyl cis-trans isomerase [Prevotella sp. P5-92]MCI7398864.1 FKBP-type peptidyl-prolyl cis-trans isomerase [Prevotella sp.]MDY4653662.1 FKBP-type peptidyl-prolyl cis-trans isomerase [Prevotella sp.]OYP57428.1 peptidylprolyl isomerase [Prevotella sp. P5-92]